MTEINALSFVSALICQYVGVTWHFFHMKRGKRINVSFWTYLVYGTRAGQGAKLFAIFGTTWFACTSGAADLINPELLWGMLRDKGIIHISSMNAILFSISMGYMSDSVGEGIGKK